MNATATTNQENAMTKTTFRANQQANGEWAVEQSRDGGATWEINRDCDDEREAKVYADRYANQDEEPDHMDRPALEDFRAFMAE